MSNEWRPRPDLNWCFHCWFNAKIESKETKIGTRFLCLSCGISMVKSLFDHEEENELPRYFTEEEWDIFWEKNFKNHKEE